MFTINILFYQGFDFRRNKLMISIFYTRLILLCLLAGIGVPITVVASFAKQGLPCWSAKTVDLNEF